MNSDEINHILSNGDGALNYLNSGEKKITK